MRITAAAIASKTYLVHFVGMRARQTHVARVQRQRDHALELLVVERLVPADSDARRTQSRE